MFSDWRCIFDITVFRSDFKMGFICPTIPHHIPFQHETFLLLNAMKSFCVFFVSERRISIVL